MCFRNEFFSKVKVSPFLLLFALEFFSFLRRSRKILYIEQHIHKYFNQEGVNSEKMQLSENYSSIIDRLVSIKREVSFEKT